MRAAVALDTLRFVERLRLPAYRRDRRKPEAEALAEVLEVSAKDLMTKTDLREVECRLDAKVDRSVAELKIDRIKWMTAALIAQAAVIAALVKLL